MQVTRQRPFPYSYRPEKTPAYTLFRAEGRSLSESLPHAVSYLRKYAFKKTTAPAESVEHFRRQHRLFSFLASPGAALDGAVKASVAMVGDLMWVRDSWKTFVQDDVRRHLDRHDVVLGNLETPISAAHRVPRFLPDVARFNAPPELLTSFRRADGTNLFTALSTANNHSLDQGVDGARATLDFLQSEGILQSGMGEPTDRPYVTFERSGIRFGFYAATFGLNDPSQERPEGWRVNLQKGLAPVAQEMPPLDDLQAALEGMEKDGVDFKIVSLHWGHEFESYPTPEQMQVARHIVALGADLLLGGHSHVPQPAEVLFVNGAERSLAPEAAALARNATLSDPTGVPRKALVVYSLGNFSTTMYTAACRLGGLQSLEVVKDPGTGRVDWHAPMLDFVFNDRGGWFGQRRLAMAANLPEGLEEARRVAALLPGAQVPTA
ncbi:MAG: CapA family protein [Candidatus Eremiobacterota bacterium]